VALSQVQVSQIFPFENQHSQEVVIIIIISMNIIINIVIMIIIFTIIMIMMMTIIIPLRKMGSSRSVALSEVILR
jgi:hypothetical protein